eukprot:4474491-Alexandrium_andersonii.AAC.1
MEGWASIRGRKAAWGGGEVSELASAIVAALPSQARSLLASDSWRGGPIVCLRDEAMWRTTECDLRTNAAFLRPVLTKYPGRVPSSFLLADVWLEVDRQLQGQ